MKKQSGNGIGIILGIILLIVIVLFALINSQPVNISFGFFKLQAIPLVMIILGSAFLGAAILFLANFKASRGKNRQIKQLTQENETIAEEIRQEQTAEYTEKLEEAQKKIDELEEELKKVKTNQILTQTPSGIPRREIPKTDETKIDPFVPDKKE